MFDSCYTWTIIQRPKAPHSKEHASFPAACHTRPVAALITRRVSRRRLCSRRVYIRVNFLHPQGTHHFSQHFLHTLFQFHYTLCSTAKIHRRRTGSRYRFIRAFSATAATQPFPLDISFGSRRRGSFTNRHRQTILHHNRF